MSVTIAGIPELQAALKKTPDVFRERLNDATETTVREIARQAQARLQASPSVRTRALLNAVTWRFSKSTGRGRVGIVSGSVAGPDGKPDAPSKRAHFVEFGTVHMPAEPFMVPAADAQQQPYLDRCHRAGQLAERDLSTNRTL